MEWTNNAIRSKMIHKLDFFSTSMFSKSNPTKKTIIIWPRTKIYVFREIKDFMKETSMLYFVCNFFFLSFIQACNWIIFNAKMVDCDCIAVLFLCCFARPWQQLCNMKQTRNYDIFILHCISEIVGRLCQWRSKWMGLNC